MPRLSADSCTIFPVEIWDVNSLLSGLIPIHSESGFLQLLLYSLSYFNFFRHITSDVIIGSLKPPPEIARSKSWR